MGKRTAAEHPRPHSGRPSSLHSQHLGFAQTGDELPNGHLGSRRQSKAAGSDAPWLVSSALVPIEREKNFDWYFALGAKVRELPAGNHNLPKGLHVNDRILRRPEVQARIGLSRSTIYAMVAEGSFPAPIKLGSRAVGWHEADIGAWLRSRESSRADG